MCMSMLFSRVITNRGVPLNWFVVRDHSLKEVPPVPAEPHGVVTFS